MMLREIFLMNYYTMLLARVWVFSSLLLVSISFAQPSEIDSSEGGRPNIILILTDDQGYGDLGITGNPIIDTPHIDALARESASMTTFYVSPVCAPTRASLMTGRYNYRTRVIDTFMGRSMMEPEEVTVAEILKEAGYATGIFGKWHLGDCYPMRPIDQGFDEALVLRGGGLAQPSEPIASGRRYTDPILIHNGTEVATRGYCTDVYFEAATGFINRSRASGKPFFVYLPTNAPHGPFHDVPGDLYKKYKNRDLTPVLVGRNQDADTVARVFAMVENVDQNVGRLMDRLEKDGLARNTIVIFMVDNGPNSRRYVGPFRGMKTEVHEGGIRSPFFVRWPARLQAGSRSDRIAAHIDVLPTLLEAAGVPVPDHLRLDGRSLLPLLEGKQVEWPERTLFVQTHRGDVPVKGHHFAVRDQEWKLVHPTGFGRNQPIADVPLELYDMSADPGEENNVASSRPEVVRRLKRDYEERFADVSSTRSDNYAPPCIILGTDHETRTVLTRQDWRVSGDQGWGRGGRWLLDFAAAATYDIELAWPEPVAPGFVQFEIGSLLLRRTLTQSTRSMVLEGVHVPPGQADLRVVLSREGSVDDPYHVILVRR
jgi:arylsulfatase A-like enzyme